MSKSNNYKLSNCKHNRRKHCSVCELDSNNCEVMPIFLDANFVLEYYLMQQNMSVVAKIIETQRKSYKIIMTNDVYGEICDSLFDNAKAEGNKKNNSTDLRIENNINKFREDSRSFYIRDIPYDDINFIKLLEYFANNKTIMCGTTDKLHICVAIYLNYEFATFDKTIIDDVKTINKMIDKINSDNKIYNKLRLFKF